MGEENKETKIVIDDKKLFLITNKDIEDALPKLDFSKISVSLNKKHGKTKSLKSRKRNIDKEEKFKRNIFHSKIMRRY